jgi:PAS domain S-box-containing protein
MAGMSRHHTAPPSLDGRSAGQDRAGQARAGTTGAKFTLPIDLEKAINRVDDGFIVLDRDWYMRYLNEAAGRRLGRSVCELVDKNIWDEFPTAVGSVFDLRYREALESQETVEFEEYFAALDTWFSIRVYPSAEGVTLVFRDITQLRLLMAERRAFVDRLLEAEDRERARIAADVHDDSVQALGVVHLQLQLLRAHLRSPSPKVDALLTSLGEQVLRAIDQLRTLLFSLEPTQADVPIARNIRVQASRVFDGSRIHWSVDDIDAGEELPPAEKSQALRITNEALTNARAHAEATEVIVTLRGDEQGLEVVVEDNGTAVDAETFTSAQGHRGLATMRDRAAVVGGWCTIEPTPPHGCTVRFFVPRNRPW